MMTWIAIGAGALILWMLWSRRGPSPVALARQAAESQDLAPILEAAAALSPTARSALFHDTISFLWRNWQRPLAARLVREYVSQCPDEKLCQYWLKQVLEVEPQAARDTFDQPFLTRFFRPEVAKSCGQGGS
jgi:hypothetical protein